MEKKIDLISQVLSKQENVEITTPLYLKGEIIYGEIRVRNTEVDLAFQIEIYPHYPAQVQNTETIRFLNKKLIEYNHVNADGSVCVHTTHSPDLKFKVQYDIDALKQWIQKYYINREKDNHYEHIIVSEKNADGIKSSFLFTNVEYTFKKGDYGIFHYWPLAQGQVGDFKMNTFIVTGFNCNNIFFKCGWSSSYHLENNYEGVFIYLDNPPVRNRRFTVSNWLEMEDFLSQEFLSFLAEFEKKPERREQIFTPLLIGYRINDKEIHWQSVIILNKRFPISLRNVLYTDKYEVTLRDDEILWGQTKNISYEYFFGRGKLQNGLTESKIVILGIGAIGSVLAKTLVRGGCKDLTLIDYDFKEPENVCRSEYAFNTGLVNKVDDLSQELFRISPFVEIKTSNDILDLGKASLNKESWFRTFQNYFYDFKIIFDCTADYDVTYLLDKIEVDTDIISLSITNHAKELVCVFRPNIYKWVIEIFERLGNSTDDLYNPTGCWSPTFKASYNDISSLVQFAIKQINGIYERNLPKRNFYLSTSFSNECAIKLYQF